VEADILKQCYESIFTEKYCTKSIL